MDARVGSTALKQDVMAVPLPRLGKGGTDNGAAMTASLKIGMGHDILDNPMLTATAQKIRNGDEHAGRHDLWICALWTCVGYKNHETLPRDGLGPDLFGTLARLCAAADARSRKQREQRSKVGDGREPDIRHHAPRQGAAPSRSSPVKNGVPRARTDSRRLIKQPDHGKPIEDRETLFAALPSQFTAAAADGPISSLLQLLVAQARDPLFCSDEAQILPQGCSP